MFCRSSFMVTDYSSVAFDMAYLQKPIIYYQFDMDDFFSGGHLFQSGYFDFVQVGFGPVCKDDEEILETIENLLQRGSESEADCRKRMACFFEFRDGVRHVIV